MTNDIEADPAAPNRHRQTFTVFFCVAVLGSFIWFLGRADRRGDGNA